MNDLAIERIRSQLTRTDFDALKREVNGKAVHITDAFEGVRQGLQALNGSQLAKVEKRTRQRDRLAGILIVTGELRMPRFAAFGPSIFPTGDNLTEYDQARTFILKQQTDVKKNRTPTLGNFYPEFMNMAPLTRMLAIAEAHVGCFPTGNKQRNLFSLNGRYSYSESNSQTQPGGTTCALFMRAVLVAAGDKRFLDKKKLGLDRIQANMAHCMGLDLDNGYKGPGWTSAANNANSYPRRGDLYFIRAKQSVSESGHVGFVRSAKQIGDQLIIETIDAGQKSNPKVPSGKGYYTHELTRIFKRSAGGSYSWEYSRSPQVPSYMVPIKAPDGKPHPRYLTGWIDFAAIQKFFE